MRGINGLTGQEAYEGRLLLNRNRGIVDRDRFGVNLETSVFRSRADNVNHHSNFQGLSREASPRQHVRALQLTRPCANRMRGSVFHIDENVGVRIHPVDITDNTAKSDGFGNIKLCADGMMRSKRHGEKCKPQKCRKWDSGFHGAGSMMHRGAGKRKQEFGEDWEPTFPKKSAF